MLVEGRGIGPLSEQAPETARGTTRPPQTTAALTSGRCRLNRLNSGGDLQRWSHEFAFTSFGLN